MALVSLYLPIITLDVNMLNSQIKRYTVAGWTRKKKKTTRSNSMLPTRGTSALKTHRSRKWRNGKRHSTQMETKKEQNYLYLHQTKETFK